MVLVYLKNLLFPKPDRSSPLLPTTTNKTYGSCNGHQCPHPECPLQPQSDTESSKGGEGPTSGGMLDPRVLSDLTIGLSDGLTVPFALTAGLSAFNDTKVVVYGGIAELIAGSISMGLGGWLAGRGEDEYYKNTLHATKTLISTTPSEIPELLHGVFASYSLPDESTAPIVASLSRSPKLPAFIMQFHHKLPPPSPRTPVSSALTIAAGYFFGGFIPLMPYFFVQRENVFVGLAWSVGVMIACLFSFGVGKTLVAEEPREAERGVWKKAVRGGLEMVAVGGVAAAAAMGIVRSLA